MEFHDHHSLPKKTKAMRTHKWDELLFENRNKQYGAYELRVNYEKRLTRSMFFVLSGVVMTVLIAVAFDHRTPPLTPVRVKDPIVIFDDGRLYFDLPQPKSSAGKPHTPTAEKPVVDPLSFKPVQDPQVKPTTDPDPVTDPVISDPGTTGTGTGVISDPGPAVGGNGFSGLPGDKPHDLATVDVQPQFPGGIEKFYEYLKNNIVYPPSAREIGMSGRIYVSFVIDENGKLSAINFLRKAGGGMEEAVEKVLLKCPSWSPGILQNEKVSTAMVIPVSFNLR